MKRNLSATLFCLPTVLVSFLLRGADNSFTVEMWDVEHGLPNSTVTGVLQSQDGYVWLSTINGLARFDGVRFVSFLASGYPGFKVGGFNQIAVSRKGDIWARMESGELVVRNKTSFSAVNRAIPGIGVRTLLTGTDGAVWATLDSGAIARCIDGKIEVLPQSEDYGGLACAPVGLPDGKVWLVTTSGVLLEWSIQGQLEVFNPPLADSQHWVGCAKDAAESVWVLGEKAIFKWNAGKWITVVSPEKASGGFKGLKAGKEGTVWVWNDKAVWRMRLGEWACGSGTNRLQTGSFSQNVSVVDRYGRVWFGTGGQGLTAISVDGEVSKVSLQEGLPSSYIIALTMDQEGNVWAGTRRGLVRVKSCQINVISWGQTQREAVATGLAETSDGSMWIGSDGEGLWQLPEMGNRAKPQSVSANPKSIRALVRDQQDRLWIGTVREGLWLLENGQLSKMQEAQLPAAEARSLLADSRGRLWIGGAKGLFSWDGGKLSSHPAPPDLGSLDVRALVEDQDGSLWIGTQGQGLMRLQAEVWQRLDSVPISAPAIVWSLHRDHQGSLWIGTGGWGLARWRGGKFDFFNRTNGFAVDTIYSIVEDDTNNLWLGTHQGIVRISKNDCEAVAEHRLNKLEPKLFTRVDGMPTLQCASGFQPNACRSHDGRLWFATDKGVVVVNPKMEMLLNRSPSVVIEEVSLLDRSVPIESGLRLGPLPRHLKFQFTALSFTAPERVRFRYRMEGEDKDWIELGTDRSVTFDNLQPGDHQFHVTACNGDGVWNTLGTSLSFTVVPIWWQTWWFKGGLAGFSLLMTVGIWWRIASRRLQRRVNEIKRQGALDRERSRIARDIHDELGTSLTRIIMLSQPPEEDELPSKRELLRIHETARELTRSMDEVVWAVNPRQDTLEGLVSYVSLFAQDFLAIANIGCRLDLPHKVPSVHLSAEVRHSVFLAVKEAINNAVRHAQAREIRIGLQVAARAFSLEVADDGVGFDPNCVNKPRAGHGLRNMHERLGTLGGHCEITSNPQKGTVVKFTMPLTVFGVV